MRSLPSAGAVSCATGPHLFVDLKSQACGRLQPTIHLNVTGGDAIPGKSACQAARTVGRRWRNASLKKADDPRRR